MYAKSSGEMSKSRTLYVRKHFSYPGLIQVKGKSEPHISRSAPNSAMKFSSPCQLIRSTYGHSHLLNEYCDASITLTLGKSESPQRVYRSMVGKGKLRRGRPHSSVVTLRGERLTIDDSITTLTSGNAETRCGNKCESYTVGRTNKVSLYARHISHNGNDVIRFRSTG
ncbi:hypothetical protein D3C78_1210770 [compost metagenome]